MSSNLSMKIYIYIYIHIYIYISRHLWSMLSSYIYILREQERERERKREREREEYMYANEYIHMLMSLYVCMMKNKWKSGWTKTQTTDSVQDILFFFINRTFSNEK